MSVTTTLTSSELVYFNGQLFAQKVMMGNHELVHNNTKVSVNQLADAMLLAAILDNESNGAIKLEMKTSKAMFGMLTTHSVNVNLAGTKNDNPENTLESSVYQVAERLIKGKGGQPVTVEDIIYNFFSEDVAWPQKNIIGMVLSALYKRGLLLTNEKNNYIPYPDTLKLIESQSVEPVQKNISNSEKSRPELHALLLKQIQSGLKKRLESDADIGGND
jgi:hypothetical protein